MKRFFDLIAASGILILLSPIIGVTAFLIRVKLGTPILFRQQRPGLHGRAFKLFKFRTMIDLRDTRGGLLPDSERLSPFGLFLRRSSLDELPSLINVIKGEMSLIGPRPLLTDYLPLYSAEQARRHEVRPGITGWAQINGRNAISWEKKFEFDVWYVDHRSFWFDMKILLLTVKKVLLKDGISAEGSATMPKFSGSNLDAVTNIVDQNMLRK